MPPVTHERRPGGVSLTAHARSRQHGSGVSLTAPATSPQHGSGA